MEKIPPFLRRILFWALIHAGLLIMAKLTLFLLSSIPPKAVNLDALILIVFRVEEVLVQPGRAFASVLPGERALGLLKWPIALGNSMLWGLGIAAVSRIRRSKSAGIS
ncbi:MAG: hypothetical protein FJ405_11185 [Verrucomicrobia bacterium]|nr:hypothetical protein [Verrucomicrobiota bacterium]